jgi:kynureninase
MMFQNSLQFARQLDRADPLRRYREQFMIPPHGAEKAIYFLGNSLGLQPVRAKTAIETVLAQWETLGVESFFKGDAPWLQMHEGLRPMLANIVGARTEEVVAMNQLTVNLHLMLVSFYRPVSKRTKILCEAKAFPSDQYMLYTHVKSRGLDPDTTIIEVAPREGEVLIRQADILSAIEGHRDELALLFWGGVNYYTGQLFDMKTLAATARNAGAVVGYDLAHAVGNVPLQLHEWNVDFACWCSYKYLNSSPGGIGGAFIHQRHLADALLHRFAGWWGNKKETRFLMEKAFDPEPSAEGWQLSTPSPVLYALHKAATFTFEERDGQMVSAEKEHVLLNDYLWFCIIRNQASGCAADTFRIITPENRSEKGCQVSLRVNIRQSCFLIFYHKGRRVCDWRERMSFVWRRFGLYNSFEEVWQIAQLFSKALHTFALLTRMKKS